MIRDVRPQAQRLAQVGPVLEVLFDTAMVGLEELADSQDGEELVLGVGLLGELRGVRWQSVSGSFQSLPGHRQGGLGHRSGSSGTHDPLEGSDHKKDFDRATCEQFVRDVLPR